MTELVLHRYFAKEKTTLFWCSVGRYVGQYVERNNDQYWYKNDLLHRAGDKPAVITADGSQYWYRNGEMHRSGDRPAIIRPDGTTVWCKYGERHRDGDLPAVIRNNGGQSWYKHGVFITSSLHIL